MKDYIEIKNAYANNLKNISLSIPKNSIVAFAGISGSGKSSLVFDIIAKESQRLWQLSYPLFLQHKMPNYEKAKVESVSNLTPSIVVNQKSLGSSSKSTVGTVLDIEPLVRLLFSRVGKPSAGSAMVYSKNHPIGVCKECLGSGTIFNVNLNLFIDEEKSLLDGAIQFSQFSSGWQRYIYQNNKLLDATKVIKNFSKEELEILYYGSSQNSKVEIKSNNTGRVDKVNYEGIIPRFERLYLKRDISKLKSSLQKEIMSYVTKSSCTNCSGTGLNPQALNSQINNLNIIQFLDLPISKLLTLLETLESNVAQSIAKQIINTLKSALSVGLGYLSLSRKTDTLSGGELQRLKLIQILSNELNNITYILDEPSTGLHPYDIEKIKNIIIDIKQRNNNILIVEHNLQLLNIADYLIELGPNAGKDGGEIVFNDKLQELKNLNTPTGRLFSQKFKINKNPLNWNDSYKINNVNKNNLKNVDVTIPKGVLTAVTGVAGSGKSTLIREEFAKKYNDSIIIDQKPIGTSIRSNSATYTGVMDEIRRIFAIENNVEASLFSFNSKGACPICKGSGYINVDMAFAEPITSICEECNGKRYSKEALGYKFKDKNIDEILNLTIQDAVYFLDNKKIKKRLKNLIDVGLGYLTLGQPTSNLSGGEIQRIKIANELNNKGNIYIFDEPSIGLHHEDVITLLSLLRNLVSNQNTVIIVEHRLELIAQADWIIDLGPFGGEEGGFILFNGTPQELLKNQESKTGLFLRKYKN
ncbi:daunorubicin resistance protein DrrC [Mammaliicoccus sciuri]|uniref:ATP-binding cassette domain-containing protein n=1 Tax=Mammaliicoccus sciuri TaxID=1296 RepID=UPI000BBE3795|nr:ATP-binding cassette domain-containing protein [Mammaliicoccus sciuri]PCM39968.1 daunorubicin resistance protein DrrC [Mammaliicoccus sciuri]